MDSKVHVLGLALKKRRATLIHPRGKEVRERIWNLEFVAAESRCGFSRVPVSW